MNPKSFAEAVRSAISTAAADGRIEFDGSSDITGHSGSKLVGLLQRLTALYAEDDAAYLEIGVFQGLTLLSVAAVNPRIQCLGIDNFAFFDPEDRNKGIVLERRERVGATNAELIDSDYEDAFETLEARLGGRKIGVYFIDGPHDYRSQLMCLLLAKPFLHPNAVVIIDDSNYAHVRQANRDFLRTDLDFRLVFEAYTEAHPAEMDAPVMEEARRGWWNGVNVIVRDESRSLPYWEPPTERDRTRFVNDHIVHAARLAELAPLSVRLTDALTGFRIPEALWLLGRAFKERRQIGAAARRRSKSRNTHSRAFVGEHWQGPDGDSN